MNVLQRQLDKNKILLFSITSILVLLQERFFYLIPISLVNVMSIFGMILIVFYLPKILSNKFEFAKMIVSLLILELYGILIAYVFYGQSVIVGIKGTHYMFLYGFYYLYCDISRKIGVRDSLSIIKSTLLFWGFISAFLVIIQWFAYPTIFLNLDYSIRNGLRIQGTQIIQYAFALCLVDLFYKLSIRNVIKVLVLGFVILFILQSRNIVLIYSIIAIILLGIKIYNTNRKAFCFACILLPIVLIICINNFGKSVLYEVIEEASSGTGTTSIRIEELNYYLNKLKENHFLGIGILGDDFSQREVIYGTNRMYYLEDIGISAFIFKTGVLGLIWTISWLFKLLKMSICHKNNGYFKYLSIFVLLKTILSMLFSVTFLFDIRDGLIYFILILVLMDVGRDLHEQEEVLEVSNTMQLYDERATRKIQETYEV